jgi:hypothetical protein
MPFIFSDKSKWNITVPDVMQSILSNWDGKGTDWFNWYKKRSLYYLIIGDNYEVIDAPAVPGQ